MRSFRQVFSAVAMLLLVTAAACPVLAEVPQGTSRFVARDRAANRARIEAGVEKAIAGLNFLFRPFARRRLSVDRFDVGVLAFRVDRGKVTIQHDAHVTTSPSSGRRVKIAEDGDVIWLSQKVEADRVLQVFEMDDGKLELTYLFSPDAKVVVIHAVLRSPKLPAPVVYHLDFDRKPK